MTCQECELKLGMGEDAGEHLTECRECRALAAEMRLNAVALRGMRARPGVNWVWAVAVVVMAAVGIYSLSLGRKPGQTALSTRREEVARFPGVESRLGTEKSVPVFAEYGAGKASHPFKKAGRRPAPLKVKMFTSDPDVVIYWIVDRKDGVE